MPLPRKSDRAPSPPQIARITTACLAYIPIIPLKKASGSVDLESFTKVSPPTASIGRLKDLLIAEMATEIAQQRYGKDLLEYPPEFPRKSKNLSYMELIELASMAGDLFLPLRNVTDV